jgi:hypothetical protein
VSKERYDNGYKGAAATGRRMKHNFKGFSSNNPASLKPVHLKVNGKGGATFGKSIVGRH